MFLKITRYVAPVLLGLGSAGMAGAQTTPDPTPLGGLSVAFDQVATADNDLGFAAGPVLFAEEVGTTSTTGIFEFKIDFDGQQSIAAAGTAPAMTRTITISAEAKDATLGTTTLHLITAAVAPATEPTLTEINSPYTVPEGETISSISMRAPLTFGGCTDTITKADLTVTVGVDDGDSTTATLEGKATITAIQCVNAYSVTIVDDSTAGGGDSSYEYGSVKYNTGISGPDIDPTADGTTEKFSDTATQATHGLITVTFDPDNPAADSDGRDIYTQLDLGPLQRLSLTEPEPADPQWDPNQLTVAGMFSGAPGEVQQISFSLRVPTDVEAVGVGSPGYVKAASLPDANNVSVRLLLGAVSMRANPYRDGIVLTLSNSAADSEILDSGTVAILNAASSISLFGINTPLQTEFATDATLLDALNVNAARCAQFDWVADPSNSQWGGNLFRVTGHGENVTEVMATFSNATASDKNGTFPLNIPGLDAGTPIELTETDLNAANANFGVADIELLFVGAAGRTLDCDRLLKPSASDLLFSYGNDRVTSVHGDD